MKGISITKSFGWVVLAVAATMTHCGAANCGDILDSWTSEETKMRLEIAIEENLGSSGGLLSSIVLPLLKYGIQIRKVCAVCSDFLEDCGYGGDVTHSGLLLIPLADDNSTDIAEGTHKAIIYNHGTRAASQPSTDWEGEGAERGEILFNAIYAATTGSVVIMPDYMSQGESYGKVFRGYLVRQAYETSVVPLYLQSQKILEEETNCSAVADSIFVTGYSEGGYASMAVAEKLSSLGYDIIRVDAGGAPLWVSRATIVDLFGSVKNGTFPSDARFFLPLFGFGFSSSRTDMVNYDMNQDVLTNSSRAMMLEIVSSDEYLNNERPGRQAMRNIVPVDDMLSIFDPELVNFVEQAIAEGDDDPCRNRPIAGVSDLLCQALQAQDLHEVLQNATYPVVVCHSPDDDIVPFGNLPDISGNPNVTLLESSGDHTEAISTCWFSSLQFILGSDFSDYLVEEKTDAICQPATPIPSEDPPTNTNDPESTAPTEDASASSSLTVLGVAFGLTSLALMLADY